MFINGWILRIIPSPLPPPSLLQGSEAVQPLPQRADSVRSGAVLPGRHLVWHRREHFSKTRCQRTVHGTYITRIVLTVGGYKLFGIHD